MNRGQICRSARANCRLPFLKRDAGLARSLADWRKLWWITMLVALSWPEQAVDLRNRYPTDLTKGDTLPEQARVWEFTEADVFRVINFHLAVGINFRSKLAELKWGSGIARTERSGL